MFKHTILVAAVAGLVLAMGASASAGLTPVFYASFENDTPDLNNATVNDDAGILDGNTNDGMVTAAAAKIGSQGYQTDSNCWPTGASGNAAGSVALPSGDNAWSFSFWYQKRGDDYSKALIRWGTANDYQHTSVWGSSSGCFLPDFVINHRADSSAWPNSSTTPPVAGIDPGWPAPDTNAWHFIVGTYTGSQGTEKLYIDGAEVDSISRTGYALNIVNNTATPWRIGHELGANSYFDDVAIWDYALSATNVALLWNGGAGNPASIIPEPATLALLGLGGVGLVLSRKRK